MPETIRVQVREGASLVVRAVPLEDYVAVTILSEFDPPAGNTRAIESMYEVQAIISRSYALARRARHASNDFDVCGTAECQVYEPARLQTSRWAALARRAADETRGEILTYGGAPAEALFHADCGGHTSSAADVWGGPRVPYLVDDRDDVDHGHDDWTFQASGAAIAAALDADPRTTLDAPLTSIRVADRDRAGRAEQIALGGGGERLVRGAVFRAVMSRRFGVKSIRSTLFSIARLKDGFVFSGKGFGHGVGLCQAGAFARLQAGETPTAVLSHYFPGTSLSGPVSTVQE
ncbi:MAG: SpoIID/LytB domain-containing protein [Vicinamibacterales bacterium]